MLKNQGFHYHFTECENRMWLISKRSLPIGVQFELANDWVMLHYSFINYIVNSNDEYLVYLKNLLLNSIMSPEVCFFFCFFINLVIIKHLFKLMTKREQIFYHTIIVNSPFCNNLIDIHLRDANFQHETGRACQCSKKFIDWCGCSPNYYKKSDFKRLKVIFLFLYF
jgi:protein xylosyltransferase